MGQLEDFRASLKKKDSAVRSEGEMPDRVGHDGKEVGHDNRKVRYATERSEIPDQVGDDDVKVGDDDKC